MLQGITGIFAADREALIAEAIAEAKEHGKKESLAREASIQALKNGKRRLTSGQMVGRLFKKATKSARLQGEARVMLEDMVYRAEKKLAEAERKAHGTQGAEARAEELARELFHKPGSMLTEEELNSMIQQTGCVQIRPIPNCNLNILNRIIRTIDGSCNNLNNPLFGAADTAFTRMIPSQYADGVDALRGGLQAEQGELFPLGAFLPPIPSARHISETIINRNSSMEEDPFTHILMQWGQFLDHDLDLSPELEAECEGCEFTELCQPIRVQQNDPAFGIDTPQMANCLRFARSLPVCDLSLPGQLVPREQLNAITSFIDGSQVYGSNERIANAVRLGEDGLLKEGKPFPGSLPSLPIDEEDIMACLNAEDCFLAGDVRANEQISLTIMHTLWFREHNRLARALKVINPFWNDERLFQEARRIVGALIQKITYEDYLPKVIGYDTFDTVIGPYIEYDDRVDPGVPNGFATAAYRYGHSLIRPAFSRLDSDFKSIARGPLKLVNAFFNPFQFKLSLGTDPLVRGWISEQVLQPDSDLNTVLTSELFANDTEDIIGMDLAALNIQRGRDHGLPPFVTWVNHCKRRFPSLRGFGAFDRYLDFLRFLQLHGSLDSIDLWIGGLAEKRLPDSFLGPTFACIFGVTFDNVRNGDRFWYENPGVFTPKQLEAIQQGSLSRIICDNTDNVDEVQKDAFLSTQPRVPCSMIPSVDLEAWREPSCFARVQINPLEDPMFLFAFSRVGSQLGFFAEQIQANQEQFECMIVQCPSLTGTTVLFATDVGRDVSMMPNGKLAENLNVRDLRYRAFWPTEVFDSEVGGVFKSLEACQNSEEVAITVSSARGILQKLEQALTQQDPDLEEGLGDFFGPVSGKLAADEAKDMEKIASDQELTAQLEQALKDLEL